MTWRDCDQSRFGKSFGKTRFLRIKIKGGKRGRKKGMEEGMEIERMKSFRAKRNVFKAHASLERVFLRMWEVSDDAIVDII